MEIKNNEFFMVTVATGRHIYDDEESAINHLRTHSEGIDPKNNDINVVKVSIDSEDWTIKELPWQQIALQLLQAD